MSYEGLKYPDFFTYPTSKLWIFQSACIEYKRKLFSNPLAWLVVLFASGHRAMEYVEPFIWNPGCLSPLFKVMACCVTAPSHYFDQCCLIVNKIIRSKYHWNINQNTAIFIAKILLGNFICKMSAFLFRPKCSKWWTPACLSTSRKWLFLIVHEFITPLLMIDSDCIQICYPFILVDMGSNPLQMRKMNLNHLRYPNNATIPALSTKLMGKIPYLL